MASSYRKGRFWPNQVKAMSEGKRVPKPRKVGRWIYLNGRYTRKELRAIWSQTYWSRQKELRRRR